MDASGNTILTGGGSFGSSESNNFCLVNGVPQKHVPKTGSFILFNERDMLYSSWEIYPTLATNFIRIDFESNTAAKQLNLISITGAILQQIMVDKHTNTQYIFNLIDVPVGINFIQVVTNNGVVASKTFVKQ